MIQQTPQAPRDDSIASLAEATLREPWLGSGFRLVDLLDPLAGLGQAPARLLGVDVSGVAEGGERTFVLELRPDGAWKATGSRPPSL